MMNKFQARLKELRTNNNVSQAQLAAVIGTTQATVSRWENGETEPDIETICKLTQFFEESSDYILGLKEF